MHGPWRKGVGRYVNERYQVFDTREGLITTLWFGITVGHGSSARKVGRNADMLVLPEHRAGGVTLPQLTLQDGMEGYWEIGDSRSLIFSPSLPDGAVESPPESALDLQDVLAKLATFRIVSAARRAVVFIASGSSGVAYAPDETAPEGSTELWLARLLSGPSGKAAISALRARAERSATDIPYHQGVMGRTITLDTDAHSWIWHNEDGSVERCDEYRRGDETINLRQMVAKGIAVPLALNRFSGEMVEVIGLTALSEVAYSGRDGNQFNFLVPCQTGQSRTIHVVVRHETGFMVYGFTVARRSDMNAEADARSRGEDPVRALTRRPVPFGQKVVRNYFVFPDGHRVVHLV